MKRLFWPFLAVLALSLQITTGCAYLKSHPALAANEINCGEDAIKAELLNLLPPVTLALSGQSANWHDQLKALEAQAGDAVLCAVATAVHALAPAVVPAAAAPGKTAMVASVNPLYPQLLAVTRGSGYLEESGKKPRLE